MKQKTKLERLRGKLFVILKERELTAYRGDIVIGFTNGYYHSTSDLNEDDLDILIGGIAAGKWDWVRDGNQSTVDNTDTPEARNRIRRNIISKLIEMGAVTNAGAADMPFIYSFIMQRWHQRFNDIPVKKLGAIVAVLEKTWLPNFYKKKAQNPDFSIKMIKADEAQKEQTEDNSK